MKNTKGCIVTGIGLIWCAAIFAGFMVLQHESFTPVGTKTVATDFPRDSAIPSPSTRPELVVFLHPYCPCSKSTLRQLDQILAETQGKSAIIVVFTIADGLESGWDQGDLWKKAQAMPGVRIVRDSKGVEANRFGVVGSGHALLFNTSGHLLFSGGITESRGHEGDNAGQDAIVNFVLHGHSEITHTPIFGCSLL